MLRKPYFGADSDREYVGGIFRYINT
jgi:hypothetical protein